MHRDNPYLNWLWALAALGLSAGLLTLVMVLGDVGFDSEQAAIIWLFVAGVLLLMGIVSLVAAIAVNAATWRPAAVVPPAGDHGGHPLPAGAPSWQPTFAGWYPDERGERYHDGERWTDQRR